MSLTKAQFVAAYECGFTQTIWFLASRGVPAGEAEDAAQGAWTVGWERRDTLRDPESILSWINTIALNLFRKHYRDKRRFEAGPDSDIAEHPKSLGPRIDLAKCLRQCSWAERLMLKQYLAGYTSKEIAKKWHLTPDAVRVRIHRAKQKLRDLGQRLQSQTAVSIQPDAWSDV